MRPAHSRRTGAFSAAIAICLVGSYTVHGLAAHGQGLSLLTTTLSGFWRRGFVELPCLDNATMMDNGVLGLQRIDQYFQVRGSNLATTVIPSYQQLSGLVEEYMRLTRVQLSAAARWPLESSRAIAEHVAALLDGDGILPYMSKVVVPAGSKLAVFGDLHGAAQSFIRQLTSLQTQGYLSDDLTVAPEHRGRFYMVLCGDWVDRGAFGVETLALVLLLKVKNPESVWLSRGNHEDKPMNEMPGTGGFYEELVRKFPDEASRSRSDGAEPFAAIWRLYEALPVATFIGVMPQGVQAAVEAAVAKSAEASGENDAAATEESGNVAAGRHHRKHRRHAMTTHQRQLLSADGSVRPASLLDVAATELGLEAPRPAHAQFEGTADVRDEVEGEASSASISTSTSTSTASSIASALPSGPSLFAQSYIMAVHGGIELGVDPYPLLHGAPISPADVTIFQLRSPGAGAAAPADTDPQPVADAEASAAAAQIAAEAAAGTLDGLPLPAAAVGPAFYFGRIHALRRRDWLDTLPPSARKRIPPSVASILRNYGADREGAAAAFARQRIKRAEEAQLAVGDAAAAAVQAAHEPQAMDGHYPTTPMGTDPALGFLWYDFMVDERHTFARFNPGRGMALGHDLTSLWLRANRISAIVRAHQHNDAPFAGPMLQRVREGGGYYDNWQNAGLVTTFLSGGHIPWLDFHWDAHGLFTLHDDAPSSWRLAHCKQEAGPQFVKLSSGWVDGREPPADLAALASELGRPHLCDPDVTRMVCVADDRWSAGAASTAEKAAAAGEHADMRLLFAAEV